MKHTPSSILRIWLFAACLLPVSFSASAVHPLQWGPTTSATAQSAFDAYITALITGTNIQTVTLTGQATGSGTTNITVTVTPPVTNITGAGTGVLAALAQSVNSANGLAPVTSPAFLGSPAVGVGSGNPIFAINGGAGGVRAIDFQTAGVGRWRLGTAFSESGANAGASLELYGYDDSGAALSTPFSVTRSGVWVFGIATPVAFQNYQSLKGITPPSTPASGFGYTYVNSANGKLYYLNSAGTAYDLTADPVAPAFVTLTDGATITWTVGDNVKEYSATVTLGGNRALAISGAVSGTRGVLKVVQDGTGSRTLSLPTGSKVVGGGSGAITLSTAASRIDMIAFVYDGTNYFWTYGTNFN